MWTSKIQEHITVILFLALISLTSNVFGQDISSVQASKYLHDGGLVIILPSYSKKIALIDSLLASDEVSRKSKSNLRKRREETLEKKRNELLFFAGALKKYYPLGPLAFAYDTVLPLNGQQKVYNGMFIDTSGHVDVQIEMHAPLLIARPVRTQEQGLEAYTFADEKGHAVARPFPKYILRHHLYDRMLGFFKRKNPEEMAARRFVRQLINAQR